MEKEHIRECFPDERRSDGVLKDKVQSVRQGRKGCVEIGVRDGERYQPQEEGRENSTGTEVREKYMVGSGNSRQLSGGT